MFQTNFFVIGKYQLELAGEFVEIYRTGQRSTGKLCRNRVFASPARIDRAVDAVAADGLRYRKLIGLVGSVWIACIDKAEEAAFAVQIFQLPVDRGIVVRPCQAPSDGESCPVLVNDCSDCLHCHSV